jgi:hypothetical protein
VKYPQQNSDSGRVSVSSKRDLEEFDSNLHKDEELHDAKKVKNNIGNNSTVLQESFSTNHHVDTDEPLDSFDKEVRRITNASPPPTHAPIFRNVNGNLVREETFAWPNQSNQSPTFSSYTTYPNARFSATNQNWIQPSPHPYVNYGYNNSYQYGLQQQHQQLVSPSLSHQQMIHQPAANYYNNYPSNYQYAPNKPSLTPSPNELQRIEQPKRVSFVTSETRQSPNEIYKQIEKHLNASVPKYEYGVEPIQPSRIRTSENLNLDKLNELKRVLNHYPHLIREAKVMDSPKKNSEEKLQIAYQEQPKVTIHKLSDLIMRSKSSSEEKLNYTIDRATQYEQKQTNQHSCCGCSHSPKYELEPLQRQKSEEINKEALEIFAKVNEIVKSSKFAEPTISPNPQLDEPIISLQTEKPTILQHTVEQIALSQIEEQITLPQIEEQITLPQIEEQITLSQKEESITLPQIEKQIIIERPNSVSGLIEDQIKSNFKLVLKKF